MIEECKGKLYEERLEIVALTTLENWRMWADWIEVFEILKEFDGIDYNMFFKRLISNTRAHSIKFYEAWVNRDVLNCSFANNRVLEQWNKLPEKWLM